MGYTNSGKTELMRRLMETTGSNGSGDDLNSNSSNEKLVSRDLLF